MTVVRAAKHVLLKNALNCVKSKKVVITSLLAMAKSTGSIKRVRDVRTVIVIIFNALVVSVIIVFIFERLISY